MKQALLLLFLTTFATSIIIPLYRNKPRCMIIYSIGQTQTIKLNIKFPEIANITTNEKFIVSWRNTQNEQTSYEKVGPGVFKKQLSLQQHILYEICFWFNTTRDIKDIFVQYKAHSLFQIKHQEVKIPQGLLKSQDLQKTFMNANDLVNIAELFTSFQKQRTVSQDQIYTQTTKVNSNLITISVIELVVVILAGAYQFWIVKGFLQQKQYI